MDFQQFENRKRDHMALALDPANEASGLSGLDQIELVHEALPDLDFKDIGLGIHSLGSLRRTPLYVSGMTAGHVDAAPLNESLAEACGERGWALGLGSQRRDLHDREESGRWKMFRARFPRLEIFGNLGISQLVTTNLDEVRNLVDSAALNALCIHANALQEVIQFEGTPDFKGAIPALERLCKSISVPVILKETGCGFSEATLRRLTELGLAAVDVSGLGGTHWGRIEGKRSPEQSLQARAAATFAHWGISTVDSVRAARKVFGNRVETWGSGGVRSGLDAAKLLSLGCTRVGFAKPALQAAQAGAKELRGWMEQIEFELRVALFCTGCQTPENAPWRGKSNG